MSDENKTAALLLAALGVQIWLGWALARAVATVDDKPDCERYWQQMAVYLQTENKADLPEFIHKCASAIPIE
jgi:hypothetical protein